MVYTFRWRCSGRCKIVYFAVCVCIVRVCSSQYALCECEACLKPSLLCHSVGGNWDFSACDFVCVCVWEKARESVKERGSDGVRKKRQLQRSERSSDRTVQRDDCQTSFLFSPLHFVPFLCNLLSFQAVGHLTSLGCFPNSPKVKILNYCHK